jgi:hypothetical protein
MKIITKLRGVGVRRLVLGSWHSVWACYHLERVGDPVTFTCSDGSCHHDNRYKHHRRALNKLSENADVMARREETPNQPES